jgi:hypothetical protein
MKFLSLADWTGIIETELFAKTYKSYGLATVRYPVLEIEARVEPFENGGDSHCGHCQLENQDYGLPLQVLKLINRYNAILGSRIRHHLFA